MGLCWQVLQGLKDSDSRCPHSNFCLPALSFSLVLLHWFPSGGARQPPRRPSSPSQPSPRRCSYLSTRVLEHQALPAPLSPPPAASPLPSTSMPWLSPPTTGRRRTAVSNPTAEGRARASLLSAKLAAASSLMLPAIVHSFNALLPLQHATAVFSKHTARR